MAWGGVAALGQRDFARLWSYAGLYNYGNLLLAMGLGLLSSWTLVLLLFGARTILILLGAMSLALLRQQAASTEFDRISGLANRLPWTVGGLLAGGMGLIGFPLTAGFAGHWAALQSLASVDWRPAAAVVVASVGAILGFVRAARLMFGSLENRTVVREGAWSIAMAVTALVLTVIVATSPQLLSNLISRALAAFG